MPKKNKISVHNDKINYTFEYDEIINVQDGINQLSAILKQPIFSSKNNDSHFSPTLDFNEINNKIFVINTLLQEIYNVASRKGEQKVNGLKDRLKKIKLHDKLKNLYEIGQIEKNNYYINSEVIGNFIMPPEIFNMYNNIIKTQTGWFNVYSGESQPQEISSQIVDIRNFMHSLQNEYNFCNRSYRDLLWQKTVVSRFIAAYTELKDDQSKSIFKEFIKLFHKQHENSIFSQVIDTINLTKIINVLKIITEEKSTEQQQELVFLFQKFIKGYIQPRNHKNFFEYNYTKKLDELINKDLYEIMLILERHKDPGVFIQYLIKNKIYSEQAIIDCLDIDMKMDMLVKLESNRLFANQQDNHQYDIRGNQEEKYQFISSYIQLKNNVAIINKDSTKLLQDFVINSLRSNKDSYKHLTEVIKMLDERLIKGNNNKNYDFIDFILFLQSKAIDFNKSDIIKNLIDIPTSNLVIGFKPFEQQIKQITEKKPIHDQTVHGKKEESSLADAIRALRERYYNAPLSNMNIPPRNDLTKIITFLRTKLQSFRIDDKDKIEWANIKRVIEANFNNLSTINDEDLKERVTNLLWLAICALEDVGAAKEVLKHEPSDKDMQERWLGWFKSAIVDSQLAYRRDRGDMSYPNDSELNKDKSCMGGNLNRIIDALNLIHPDVEIKVGQETANNMARYLENMVENQGEAKINDFAQNKIIELVKQYLEKLSLTELISIKKELTNWTNAYENEQEYTSPVFNNFKVNLTRYILDAAEIKLGPVIVNRVTGRNDTDKLIKFIDPAAFDLAAEKIKDIVSQHSRAGILFSSKENQKNQKNNPTDPKRRKSI